MSWLTFYPVHTLTTSAAFSIACCILVSESLVSQYAQFARRLLKYFVESVRLLYGERMLSYNLHAMLHLTDDAERYSSLDYCSAFPFENHLYQLKRKIQPGRNPLVQAYNRLCEAECGPSLERHCKRSKVSCKQPSNHYITTNQRCVSVLAVYNNIMDASIATSIHAVWPSSTTPLTVDILGFTGYLQMLFLFYGSWPSLTLPRRLLKYQHTMVSIITVFCMSVYMAMMNDKKSKCMLSTLQSGKVLHVLSKVHESMFY